MVDMSSEVQLTESFLFLWALRQVAMRAIRIAILSSTICLLASCDRSAPAQVPPPAATHQLPTATEIFHLRSECARLGGQILTENVIGRALTQSQTSNYSEKANRCYVELTVQSADLTKPQEIMRRYLFDGQTKELLATAAIERGADSGIAYKETRVVGFEKANEYINEKMADTQQ